VNSEPMLNLARKLIGEVTFCVAVTQGDGGDANARIVQPRPLGGDWSVDVLTNRRCRKVREVERTGRLTLLYQHDKDRSYVSLIGPARIVDDVDFKRSVWTEAHYRWNPGGPEDQATVYPAADDRTHRALECRAWRDAGTSGLQCRHPIA